MADLYSRQVRRDAYVKVTVDREKFTPEFMEEFRQYMFDFDTVEEHMEHLGRLYASGIIDGDPTEEVEGYGPLRGMGISFKLMAGETEMLHAFDEIVE